MNAWQTAQQLQHLLQIITWSQGSAGVVFGDRGVRIFGGAPSEQNHPKSFPFALVQIGSSTTLEDDSLPSDATLYSQTMEVVVACMGHGDALGEQAIIGGPRPDLGYSEGAGLAELVERTHAAIGGLTGADGSGVTVATAGTTAVQSLTQDHRHIAFEELTVTCACTRAAFYAAPQHFRDSEDGLTWVGAHCSSRFDFQDYEVGYVAGSTPATAPSDYAWVSLGTTTSTSFEHTTVEGRVYSVFARYSPRGTTSASNFSHVEVGSYLVVEGGG